MNERGPRITVREIQSTEGPELRAIRLRALADSPEAFGSTLEETARRPMSYWEMRARGDTGSEASTLFVAEDKGVWVGLVGGFFEKEGEKRTADLVSMWVDPEYRGRGIGRQLVAQVIDWARHHGAVGMSLWVTDGNTLAEDLYARCGFRRTGETQPHPSQAGLLEQRMLLNLE
jgi:GNAT superfamily N-acetyltransferase